MDNVNCDSLSTEEIKKYNYSYYLNDMYIIIKDKCIICDENISYMKIKFEFVFFMFISFLIMICNLQYKHKLNNKNEIVFARVSRTKNKIHNIFPEAQFIEDDIKNFNFMIYRVGNRHERFRFILKDYLKLCITDYNEIKVILNDSNFQPFKKTILAWFVKRIPHTVIYAKAVDNIIKNYNLTTIYTGQMQDRFALIEYKTSRMYNKTLVCIPHGVETCYYLPSGLAGDIIYCTSYRIANHLNNLYETSKFIFDNNILYNMYRIKNTLYISDYYETKKIVFFTQPIETELSKKIIIDIAKFLGPQRKLYIKLHPLEKKENYDFFNTEVIVDFNSAIYGSLCISFCSTVLLEAQYNNSVALSIINMVKNQWEITCEYEYLKDSRIKKPQSFQDIMTIINGYLFNDDV